MLGPGTPRSTPGAGAEAAAFSVQFGDEVEAQVRTLLALLSLVSDPVEGNDRMGNHIDADHRAVGRTSAGGIASDPT